jgi:hypothetical protein
MAHGLTDPYGKLAPSPLHLQIFVTQETWIMYQSIKSEYFLLLVIVAEINSYLCFENRFCTGKGILYYPIIEFLFIF